MPFGKDQGHHDRAGYRDRHSENDAGAPTPAHEVQDDRQGSRGDRTLDERAGHHDPPHRDHLVEVKPQSDSKEEQNDSYLGKLLCDGVVGNESGGKCARPGHRPASTRQWQRSAACAQEIRGPMPLPTRCVNVRITVRSCIIIGLLGSQLIPFFSSRYAYIGFGLGPRRAGCDTARLSLRAGSWAPVSDQMLYWWLSRLLLEYQKLKTIHLSGRASVFHRAASWLDCRLANCAPKYISYWYIFELEAR